MAPQIDGTRKFALPEKTDVCRAVLPDDSAQLTAHLNKRIFLAKPFRFLHLSRFAMMILALLLCTCAAGTSPLAFERRTTSTKIEYKHMLGFSGLLISLENYISFLAEKQGNTTMMSGTNHFHFNLADDAVGKDVNSDTEEIFLADSWNESNLSNCSLSLFLPSRSDKLPSASCVH